MKRMVMVRTWRIQYRRKIDFISRLVMINFNLYETGGLEEHMTNHPKEQKAHQEFTAGARYLEGLDKTCYSK